MNKTKRTLIVSSVVMALIVIVTAVSVTAAWFTNVADSNEDGFTTDSALLQESASIDIDSKASGYGTALWPAVATPGYLEKGNVAPYGTELKQAQSGKIETAAKCAVIYFPISFIGSPDVKTNESGSQTTVDGRKSLCLQVEYAHLGTKSEDDEEITIEDSESKDYLTSFNVEMALVTATKNGDTTTITPLPSATTPTGTADDVYYYQPYRDEKELLPAYKLYMLVKPNVTYYVQATIYFNQIDEECDETLLYIDAFKKANKAIVFKFEIKTDLGSDVDIREGNTPV